MELHSVEDSAHGITTGSRASAVNLVRRLDTEGQHSLALPSNNTVVENGIQSWNWREAMTNGGDRMYGGKVIQVKLGEAIKRIGVDGTAGAIKDVIKSSFGLRTDRAFWLEDEEGIIRSLDREMPAGAYTLHLDQGCGFSLAVCVAHTHAPYLLMWGALLGLSFGIEFTLITVMGAFSFYCVTVKICFQEKENDHLLEPAEEKTFYTEAGFYEFLKRRQWTGLREVGSFREIDSFDELRPMSIYQRA